MRTRQTEQSNKKVYIFIIVILVAIAAVFIILFADSKEEKENRIEVENVSTKLVDEYFSFYSMQSIVNKYLFTSNSEEVYYMLDEEYIKENNITKENALEIAKGNMKGMNFKCQKVYENGANNRFKDIYVVNGIVIENGLEDLTIVDKDFNVIVLLDYNNFTFSIYPNSKEVKEKLKDRKTLSIEKNSYNKMPQTGVKNSYDLCLTYYNDFVFKLNYLPDDAYELLDDSSKEKYSIEELLATYGILTTLKTCKQSSNGKMYIAMDSSEKVVQINEVTFMNYNVHLE